MAGRAKAMSEAVRMAFLPKKEYLEKNTENGIAMESYKGNEYSGSVVKTKI